MAENTETAAPVEKHEEPRRWLSSDRYFAFVMMALVAVAAAGFGAGLAVGGNGDAERDTFGHRLEAWAGCLADEGAEVPTVEARADGSFTLAFEAGFFEDFEIDRFFRSAVACRDVMPLEELVEMLGVPPELFTSERRPFPPDEGLPIPDLLEELERRAEAPLLDLLGQLPRGQLERLCRSVFDSDDAGIDEGLLRQLRRICDRDG